MVCLDITLYCVFSDSDKNPDNVFWFVAEKKSATALVSHPIFYGCLDMDCIVLCTTVHADYNTIVVMAMMETMMILHDDDDHEDADVMITMW